MIFELFPEEKIVLIGLSFLVDNVTVPWPKKASTEASGNAVFAEQVILHRYAEWIGESIFLSIIR